MAGHLLYIGVYQHMAMSFKKTQFNMLYQLCFIKFNLT